MSLLPRTALHSDSEQSPSAETLLSLQSQSEEIFFSNHVLFFKISKIEVFFVVLFSLRIGLIGEKIPLMPSF
jgi:hypothetical protein